MEAELQEFYVQYRDAKTGGAGPTVVCDRILVESGLLWFFRGEQIIYVVNVDTVRCVSFLGGKDEGDKLKAVR